MKFCMRILELRIIKIMKLIYLKYVKIIIYLKIDLIADNPKSLFDLRTGLNRKKDQLYLMKSK